MTKKETKKKILFTVAECGEMHAMGVYRDDISTIEEAIDMYKSIDPERMQGFHLLALDAIRKGTSPGRMNRLILSPGKKLTLDTFSLFRRSFVVMSVCRRQLKS